MYLRSKEEKKNSNKPENLKGLNRGIKLFNVIPRTLQRATTKVKSKIVKKEKQFNHVIGYPD